DLVLVHRFESSRWKSNTRWSGCQIREQCKEYSFLSMEHVIRGALLTRVSSSPDELIHFVMDTMDEEMFLRADV
ncbi:hypothetical protein B0H13DRAFT_1662334, partial [Mycena leptocephala]